MEIEHIGIIVFKADAVSGLLHREHKIWSPERFFKKRTRTENTLALKNRTFKIIGYAEDSLRTAQQFIGYSRDSVHCNPQNESQQHV